MFGGLFRKRSKEAPAEFVPVALAILEQFSSYVMSHYGESEFQGDSQAKQVLSVYCFGGVSALAMQNGMSQAQAHAVCISYLNKFFLYSFDEAAQKTEALISAASDVTSHLYGIIHRGMDGFLHWQESKDDVAANDFAEIMVSFTKDAPPNSR